MHKMVERLTAQITEGGPYAFPSTVVVPKDGTESIHIPGLTLRDWLAGQALIGLMGSAEAVDMGTDEGARTCYAMADAMLKARTPTGSSSS